MSTPPSKVIKLDALVIGGGVTGLWTLDRLVAAGHDTALVEQDALGQGQTICAQGILHGGTKYSLSGLLAPGARQVAEMPDRWKEHLEGANAPDLGQVRVRSEACHLWRTDSMKSIISMAGAKVALQVKPEPLQKHERPAVLAGCPGDVARLPELVLEMPSLLETLAALHPGRIIRGRVESGTPTDGEHHRSAVTVALGEEKMLISARYVILCGGTGNEDLLRMFSPDSLPVAMQRRPLHMAMVKGADDALPELNGHCVDGAKTRVTITSSTASDGERVWQLGGELSEIGCGRGEDEQRAAARACLRATLPGFDVDDDRLKWGTYRIDRAEQDKHPARKRKSRPDDVTITKAGGLVIVWPTKMVLAPRAARQVSHLFEPGTGAGAPQFPDQSPPPIAKPPWETATWH